MKKNVLFLVLLIVLVFTVSAQQNGYSWKSFDYDQKKAFVLGYRTAFGTQINSPRKALLNSLFKYTVVHTI